MKQHTIQLYPLGKKIVVNENTPLIDVLHEYGIEFPCGGKGTCGKCKIKLLQGNIHASKDHFTKIEKLGLGIDWRLACLSKCTSDITIEVDQLSNPILADETEFVFTPKEGYGIAVDLGTTTIVTQLIDLSDARVIAVETAINPQTKYGSDLISRIKACLEGNQLQMKELIRSAIGDMIERILEKQKVTIKKVVIVGNTAMQLIFSGEDVSGLSVYPFFVSNTDMKQFSSNDLSWNFTVSEGVWFYPSIASFVGSDILAGILATGLYKKSDYVALIDLGTNGEIAIGNQDRIVCASTAAGPAFEGASITMGMRAETGAISSIDLHKGKIITKTIGNIKPKGICGSALIDAVTVFRKLNLIGLFGEIYSGESKISIDENIYLTQKDINEFQLAKSALATGMTILLQNLSISKDQIKEVYIAGGFGNYINLENVTEIGMINHPPEKIRRMGNTALIGAKMFLFEDIELVEEILDKTKHINLEGNPNFQDIFVDNLLI
jgi:uncharacterized 2Fe-2S/4Fe-4S cluster protein (DUF4445 family)